MREKILTAIDVILERKITQKKYPVHALDIEIIKELKLEMNVHTFNKKMTEIVDSGFILTGDTINYKWYKKATVHETVKTKVKP